MIADKTSLAGAPFFVASGHSMEPVPVATRLTVTTCPVCRSTRLHYLFSTGGFRIVRCEDCALMLTNPQPPGPEIGRLRGEDHSAIYPPDAPELAHIAGLRQSSADLHVDLLQRYGLPPNARLLEIGCGEGDFLICAQARGLEVTGVDFSEHACEAARRRLGGRGNILQGELADLTVDHTDFDVCVLSYVLEQTRDPRALLAAVHRTLKPGGVLFIATPTLDSWPARVLRDRWGKFRPDHLWYFKSSTLQTLLIQSDFGNLIHRPDVKTVSLDVVAGLFEGFPVALIRWAARLTRKVVPLPLQRRSVNLATSGMVIMARKQAPPARRKLSIVIPVYNEAPTFETAFSRLLAKEVEGLDLELVVVESLSTDGTRDLVRKYEGHPRVNILWEDTPKGKGHAVRAGLEAITGDYVLIQDADLEYDLEDYEALLEPLVLGRAAFVLGARHGGSAWKMRQFTGQPALTMILNGAHWFFTLLVNVLYGARLKDPFTMYKVFRRDCLYGLRFECDRFDFDFELVIKLLRKGYVPLEIPVNYRSRSFHEGKKVSFFRDPLTWLRVLAVCRMQKVDPLAEIETERKSV